MQSKSIALDKQKVYYKDLGIIPYQEAWDYQERLLQRNVAIKSEHRKEQIEAGILEANQPLVAGKELATQHFLLFCEHPSVYTLGKSGSMDHVLLSDADMAEREIQFFKTNRGGDITFHGRDQVVGYPIFDLEKFYTDIGRYLRELEEVIILTLKDYGIRGERSAGETGVWIEPSIPGKERKICAMGVRCSRWITMHGFALNVNTDLSYFNHIIPCGIQNKQVTSIEKELGYKVDMEEVKARIQYYFEQVFGILLTPLKEDKQLVTG